jgi:hypothetical protein
MVTQNQVRAFTLRIRFDAVDPMMQEMRTTEPLASNFAVVE